MNFTLKKYFDLLVFYLILFFIYTPKFILIDVFPIYVKVGLRLVCITIIFFLSLIKMFKEKKIDRFSLVFLIYSLWFLIVTVINKGYIVNAIYQGILLSLACLLFVFYYIDNKKSFIINSYIYFSILTICNLLFSIIFNINNFIFMNSNNNFYFYLPLVLFSILVLEFNKKFIYLNIILYSIISYTSILYDATSTLILISFFIMFCYFFNNKFFIYFFNKYTYIFILMLVFIFVILPGSNSIILPVFSKLLNKSITLTGRTPIYDLVVKRIIENPILGYGILNDESFFQLINHYNCHNILFDQIFKGGILGLVLFIFLIYYVIKDVLRTNIEKYKNIFITFIFVYFLRNMFESPAMETLAYSLSLVYYMSNSYRNNY